MGSFQLVGLVTTAAKNISFKWAHVRFSQGTSLEGCQGFPIKRVFTFIGFHEEGIHFHPSASSGPHETCSRPKGRRTLTLWPGTELGPLPAWFSLILRVTPRGERWESHSGACQDESQPRKSEAPCGDPSQGNIWPLWRPQEVEVQK